MGKKRGAIYPSFGNRGDATPKKTSSFEDLAFPGTISHYIKDLKDPQLDAPKINKHSFQDDRMMIVMGHFVFMKFHCL